MNMTINRLIKVLGIGLMGGTAFLPTVQAFAHTSAVETIKTDSYTPEALAAYQKTQILVQKAKETKAIGDIRKAYKSFILITPHMNAKNYYAYAPNDKMDQIYLDVRKLLYEVTPEKNRKQEILRFADRWEKLLIKNTGSLYTYHFRYFVMKNTIKGLDNSLANLEKELNRYVNGIPTENGMIPLPTDEEMKGIVNDFFDKYGADKPDSKDVSDREMDVELNKQFAQDNANQIVGETVTYEESNGVWYEVTQTIANGKVIKTNRRALSKAESYPLLVQQNPLYDPSSTVEHVETVTEREWDYLTSNQNPESEYTIHYTVNKDDVTPYYYDTGIRVNRNKAATYEQYKDVLLVLADKTGGHLVEDKNKILVVLEGKPIVVNDVKKHYAKTELESLFEDFDQVDIRIMETRIGKAGSLEEQIVSKQAKSIDVDGKEVKLETFPMVKNERALLPLEEIAHTLGAKVSKTGDTYVTKKDGKDVIFRLKDDSVYVDGKAISMKNAPIYKEDVLMVEVNELATAFGYSVVWDGENSKISFEKE